MKIDVALGSAVPTASTAPPPPPTLLAGVDNPALVVDSDATNTLGGSVVVRSASVSLSMSLSVVRGSSLSTVSESVVTLPPPWVFVATCVRFVNVRGFVVFSAIVSTVPLDTVGAVEVLVVPSVTSLGGDGSVAMLNVDEVVGSVVVEDGSVGGSGVVVVVVVVVVVDVVVDGVVVDGGNVTAIVCEIVSRCGVWQKLLLVTNFGERSVSLVVCVSLDTSTLRKLGGFFVCIMYKKNYLTTFL